MVWASSTPPAVAAIRAMLAQVPAWSGWGANGGDAYHYPQFAGPTDAISPEAMPAVLVVPVSRRIVPYAAGAIGLHSGTMTLVLYAPVTYEASDLETIAENILTGLRQVSAGSLGTGGLANLSGTVELAGDPTPGQRAKAASGASNAAYRTIRISLTYGLSP